MNTNVKQTSCITHITSVGAGMWAITTYVVQAKTAPFYTTDTPPNPILKRSAMVTCGIYNTIILKLKKKNTILDYIYTYTF